MRLIDADALKYTMLYKENWLRGTGVEAPAVWKSDVDAMPTVDAVEVVRCRECKRYFKNDEYCDFHDRDIDPDGYCAWVERREDGLYESLKRGLKEAIAFENGEIECRTETREDGAT